MRAVKRDLLEFLIGAKREGKSRRRLRRGRQGQHAAQLLRHPRRPVDYVVDRSPHKQGRFLPGTHSRSTRPSGSRETKPDYVLILPWNLTDEIVEQMAHVRDWGGRFVVPIPRRRSSSEPVDRAAHRLRPPRGRRGDARR